MPSQGPYYASTIAESGTDLAWTNPADARVLNAVYASATANASVFTKYLTYTNFGFTIATGNYITGVLIEVYGYTSYVSGAAASSLANVGLVLSGSTIGTTTGAMPLSIDSPTWEVEGGSTDRFGATLNSNTPNDSTFGFQFRASIGGGAGFDSSANIDSARMTVYYEPNDVHGFFSADLASSAEWTTPDNARLSDGSLATIVVAGGA